MEFERKSYDEKIAAKIAKEIIENLGFEIIVNPFEKWITEDKVMQYFDYKNKAKFRELMISAGVKNRVYGNGKAKRVIYCKKSIAIYIEQLNDLLN